jgi:hypothetical protein
MEFYSKSPENLRTLPLNIFAHRIGPFDKALAASIKFQKAINGVK